MLPPCQKMVKNVFFFQRRLLFCQFVSYPIRTDWNCLKVLILHGPSFCNPNVLDMYQEWSICPGVYGIKEVVVFDRTKVFQCSIAIPRVNDTRIVMVGLIFDLRINILDASWCAKEGFCCGSAAQGDNCALYATSLCNWTCVTGLLHKSLWNIGSRIVSRTVRPSDKHDGMGILFFREHRIQVVFPKNFLDVCCNPSETLGFIRKWADSRKFVSRISSLYSFSIFPMVHELEVGLNLRSGVVETKLVISRKWIPCFVLIWRVLVNWLKRKLDRCGLWNVLCVCTKRLDLDLDEDCEPLSGLMVSQDVPCNCGAHTGDMQTG